MEWNVAGGEASPLSSVRCPPGTCEPGECGAAAHRMNVARDSALVTAPQSVDAPRKRDALS